MAKVGTGPAPTRMMSTKVPSLPSQGGSCSGYLHLFLLFFSDSAPPLPQYWKSVRMSGGERNLPRPSTFAYSRAHAFTPLHRRHPIPYTKSQLLEPTPRPTPQPTPRPSARARFQFLTLFRSCAKSESFGVPFEETDLESQPSPEAFPFSNPCSISEPQCQPYQDHTPTNTSPNTFASCNSSLPPHNQRLNL
jgi:hypothetical protein